MKGILCRVVSSIVTSVYMVNEYAIECVCNYI